MGATGAVVNHDREKYSDSPAFGYGGFIIPVENALVFTRVNTVISELPPPTGVKSVEGDGFLFLRRSLPQAPRVL